ncbi:MAG: DUF4331 family protein [Pyrinomonadaceae bacterium]
MTCSRNKKVASAALALTMALALLLTPPTPIDASDHIDSPTLAHDKGSDINDMYFFRDPVDSSRVVMIMTVNPFLISSEIIGQAIFDHNIRYRFEIENTGDARPDAFVDVTFARGLGRELPQTGTVRLPNGRTFTGLVTPGLQGDTPPDFIVTTDATSGAMFYAGAPDDPFFLDNTAANRFVLSSIRNPGNPDRGVFAARAGFNAPDGTNENADTQGTVGRPTQTSQPTGPGRDTYSGFNTLLIAVSVPATLLRGAATTANANGNLLGLNGVTQRRSQQIFRRDGQVVGAGPYVTVDREGNPLVVNGLIPPARKDEYNGATTLDDANGRFRDSLIESLNNFGTNVTNRNMILTMIQVNGDIIRLNLTVPNTGPGGGNNTTGGPLNMGGRRLSDDVGDAIFTLINNGNPLTNTNPLGDFVDRNDAPFRDVFPYVAFPIQPNPKGINNPDTRIRL